MAHKLELDAQTNEVIERELNAAEIEQRTKDLAKYAALAEAKIERAAVRQAALNKLGLTADEINAIFG